MVQVYLPLILKGCMPENYLITFYDANFYAMSTFSATNYCQTKSFLTETWKQRPSLEECFLDVSVVNIDTRSRQ